MFAFDIPELCTTSGMCTLCQKTAEWICQRCMDFYCSPDCQRKDWQRHRYICFSMPGLMPAAGLVIEPSMICKNQLSSKHMGSDNVVRTSREEFSLSGQSNILKKCDDENKNLPYVQKSQAVILQGFISSNVCFVRPLKESDAYMAVMKKIDNQGRRVPQFNNLPSPVGAALSMLNGVMSRVEILSIQDEKHVKVLFFDYGITAIVDVCDLRVAPEDILSLPRFSTSVKLHNVKTFLADKSFFQIFEGIECEMRNFPTPNGEVEVELVSIDGKIHVNEEIEKYSNINNAKLSKCKSDTVQQLETDEVAIVSGTKKEDLLVDLSQDLPFQSSEPPILKPTISNSMRDFERKPLLTPPFDIYVFKPDMANFKVVVLDTSALSYGYIGCIAETDLKYLVIIQEYLAKYKDKEHFYKPKLHEYCLARFENEWYRARVVKVIDQARYAVVYLDFTNENILTSADIRRYPEELNGPCRTNLCLIDGLPKSLKSEHIHFLKKEITTESKILVDSVKEVVQQIVVIQCSNIIKKMNSLGLI